MLMIQKKVLTRTLSGILVGGMLLSFGGFALAGTDKTTDTKGIKGKFAPFGMFMKQGRGMHQEGFKGLNQKTLNLLVKEGTISQEKADEIKAYLDKKAEERKAQLEQFKNLNPEEWKAQFKQKGLNKIQRTDLFSELVANNILTPEKADIIKAKLQETMKQQQQQLLSEKLKALVEKGTFTQEQADQIKTKLEAAQKEQEALSVKIKEMTPEERRQYRIDNKGKFKNPIAELVTDGTITQEQVKSLGKLRVNNRGHQGGRF